MHWSCRTRSSRAFACLARFRALAVIEHLILNHSGYRRSLPLSLAMAACACATRLLMAAKGSEPDTNTPDAAS